MDNFVYLFEIFIVGLAATFAKVTFSTDIPIKRQANIFMGSLLMSCIVGYAISESGLSKFWYILSIAVSALFGETIVKNVEKILPNALKKYAESKLNVKIDEKDESKIDWAAYTFQYTGYIFKLRFHFSVLTDNDSNGCYEK